jgi:hypothetical protein
MSYKMYPESVCFNGGHAAYTTTVDVTAPTVEDAEKANQTALLRRVLSRTGKTIARPFKFAGSFLADTAKTAIGIGKMALEHTKPLAVVTAKAVIISAGLYVGAVVSMGVVYFMLTTALPVTCFLVSVAGVVAYDHKMAKQTKQSDQTIDVTATASAPA